MQIDNQPIKVRNGDIKERHASGNARAASSSPSSPREERVGRGPRRGATNKNAPPLPSPTAIELSIGTPSVGRPLPARNEQGEGWGEGKSNKNATPLPGPLLLLRRRRGRRARSIPLIQVQCSPALSSIRWRRGRNPG